MGANALMRERSLVVGEPIGDPCGAATSVLARGRGGHARPGAADAQVSVVVPYTVRGCEYPACLRQQVAGVLRSSSATVFSGWTRLPSPGHRSKRASRHAVWPTRQGAALAAGVRRRDRRRRCHARRRRLDRSRRDPSLRRRSAVRRRFRQGVAVDERRRQRRHHVAAAPGQSRAQRRRQHPVRHRLHRPLLRLSRLLGCTAFRWHGVHLATGSRSRTQINVRVRRLRVVEVPSFEHSAPTRGEQAQSLARWLARSGHHRARALSSRSCCPFF